MSEGAEFFAQYGLKKEASTGIRKLAVKLSLATKTPIPYWLSLSLIELYDWIDPVNEASREFYPDRGGEQ